VNSGKPILSIFCFSRFQAAVLALLLAMVPGTWAQNPAVNVADDRSTTSARPDEQSSSAVSRSEPSRKLSIGPDDELDVSVYGVPELSQHVRVDTSGDVHLLLIGPAHVEGLSSEEAQAVIEKQLVEGRFVKNPHVTVYVKEFTSQSISVVGEVNKPGNYPALSTRRLYDSFQQAGGLTPTAGKVTITHPGQLNNPTIVTLSNDPIKSAQANVEIMPGDAITVSKAPIVYVMGEVNKPGGYVLDDDSNVKDFQGLTVMRVIALASGPVHGAALNRSLIIRRTSNGLQELPIRLKQIMAGKAPDPPLEAEDILYIPGGRNSTYLSTVLGTLTAAAIYRF
jgi:polysaccharide export outer membrane protein